MTPSVTPEQAAVLGSTLFGSLHKFKLKDIKSVNDVQAECKKLQAKYNGWLSQLPNLPNVHRSITIHPVRSDLMGEVAEDADCKVLNADTKHFYVGVVVEFSACQI